MWLCRSHSVCHQWDTSVANTLFFLVFYHRLNWILAPEESELAAVGSRRMLFPNCGGIPGSQDMPPSRGQSTVTDLGLGLQSLRLSGWDRPWSSQETDTHAPPSQHQASSPSSKYWTLFVFGYCRKKSGSVTNVVCVSAVETGLSASFAVKLIMKKLACFCRTVISFEIGHAWMAAICVETGCIFVRKMMWQFCFAALSSKPVRVLSLSLNPIYCSKQVSLTNYN